MIGLICGLLICYQPAPASPSTPPRPGLSTVGLIVNDTPVRVYGWTQDDGRRTWLWRDQRCEPTPPTSARCRGSCERTWADGEINGEPCQLWGWYEAGRFKWRWDEQRHNYQPTGDFKAEAETSTPVKSGVVLPSGFEPNKDPRTGALLMGVDAKGLARDGEAVRASDPQTKAEAEDVRKFYAMGPDASAKSVARNLPAVISPNAWAKVFGYDLPTALTRVGAVAFLAAAAYLVHRFGRCPA